jgi:D-arabinose 1-dehydrogenase-like Zn-dependent alcohol dehydrogenase
VKVGPEAKRWKVGDRVGRGWHGGHCFECEQCRRGDFTMCAAHSGCGSSVDGGYQEYMVAPWESLAAVPEGMSPIDAAPLLCAGLTVFNSLRHQNVKPGRLVGVQGVGGLGHYAIQFAVKMGYEVVAITSPDKVEWAKKLGAKHVVDTSKFPADAKVEKNAASELKKLGGCSVIMCTGMGADQMSALIGGLAIGGVLLTLGVDMQKPLQVIL